MVAVDADAYVSADELKKSLNLELETFADDDVARAINSASQLVNEWCRRRFYKDASDTTRVFTASARTHVWVDDVVSVTSLATDETGDGTHDTTWASGDYLLEPANAAADGRPYTKVTVTSQAPKDFPVTRQGVQVVGVFGWPSVPDLVVEACRIQAARIVKRTREAPMGVAGVGPQGEGIRLLSKLDADVELMLQPLRRHPVQVSG